mmetsp:Transcript_8732/g.18465  ORF Transcript_8732/g.18465 Transcript_8732/m.18465 type:complete len:346 (-) Transcript_8732:271-1308(-)
MRKSKYTVVLTGAGISTSAGIPDFRGPSGIWTREQEERKRKKRNGNKKRKKSGEKSPNNNSNNNNNNINMSIVGGLDVENETNEKLGDIGYQIPRRSLAGNESNGRKRKQSELQEAIKESKQQTTKKFISFETALPTYTHRALTHLILHPPKNNNSKNKRTYLHHIVTQNVDGLHQKTNLPRTKLSVLHGDIFTETCDLCSTEHVRPHEIQSIGLRHTGRRCTLGGTPPGSCPGKLKDTLLDWEDDLPRKDWTEAETQCSKADLVVCFGTSLRIEPAAGLCEYPTAWPIPADSEEKLGYAIVNLQKTPYDEGAQLVVRARVDDAMTYLMGKLGYSRDWDAIFIDD